MGAYETLGEQVAQGSLRVIHIDAVARSMSTVLGRALAEGDDPSMYVNEPFNRFSHDIDGAAQCLLDAHETHPTREPVTIITKSIARNIPLETFNLWMTVCSGLVLSVRDPRIQIGSLLTRIANDRFVDRGADTIALGGIYPYVHEIVADEFEKVEFKPIGWPALGEHLHEGTFSEPIVTIDGEALAADPQAVLRGACRQLGLTYSPNMISGWRKPFINAKSADIGYGHRVDEHGMPTNAWIRRVATSSGFDIPSSNKDRVDFNRLPLSLQEHITDVALPIYHEAMDRVRIVNP